MNEYILHEISKTISLPHHFKLAIKKSGQNISHPQKGCRNHHGIVPLIIIVHVPPEISLSCDCVITRTGGARKKRPAIAREKQYKGAARSEEPPF